jgi:hypothetical protein
MVNVTEPFVGIEKELEIGNNDVVMTVKIVLGRWSRQISFQLQSENQKRKSIGSVTSRERIALIMRFLAQTVHFVSNVEGQDGRTSENEFCEISFDYVTKGKVVDLLFGDVLETPSPESYETFVSAMLRSASSRLQKEHYESAFFWMTSLYCSDSS